MRRLTVFALAVELVTACSSGSTGPKPANVSGTWSGVEENVVGGGPNCPMYSVTLVQSDTSLTGSYTFTECDLTQSAGQLYTGGDVSGDSVYFGSIFGDFQGTVSGNTMTDSTFYGDGIPFILTRQ